MMKSFADKVREAYDVGKNANKHTEFAIKFLESKVNTKTEQQKNKEIDLEK